MASQNADLQFADPDVFISYAKEDYVNVRKLYDRLTKDGVNAWLDTHNLKPGHDWDLVITSVIQKAKYFIVCLSSNAVLKTGYLQKEIRLALEVAQRMPEGKLFIVPVRLEDCAAPTSLQKWQWVDLFRRGGYRKITDAILPSTPMKPRRAAVRVAKPEITELRSRLQDPADMLLFDRIVERRQLAVSTLGSRAIAVSDGAYAEFREGKDHLLVELAQQVVPKQEVSPLVFRRFTDDPKRYRQTQYVCHKASFVSGKLGGEVVLQGESGSTLAIIAAHYWNIQSVRNSEAAIYAPSPREAVVFEIKNQVVAVAMPLKP